MKTQPPITEYLTIKDAASLLGVSVDTLRNWDKKGKFQAFRHPLNGYRLYRREDLAALLLKISSGRSDHG